MDDAFDQSIKIDVLTVVTPSDFAEKLRQEVREPAGDLSDERTVLGQGFHVEIRCTLFHHTLPHPAPAVAIATGSEIPFRIKIGKRLVPLERSFRISGLVRGPSFAIRIEILIEMAKLLEVIVKTKLHRGWRVKW